ncbi:hypothetical protein CBM2625_A180158 [Cupriavidus taiwanensis]|nr:hypothetical protein CBM2614_A230036 [Cupriavidus taiwanensis]SPA05189.1 hypothetical protein CBM2625_A180158 [Cupriavidus taiwanensis]
MPNGGAAGRKPRMIPPVPVPHRCAAPRQARKPGQHARPAALASSIHAVIQRSRHDLPHPRRRPGAARCARQSRQRYRQPAAVRRAADAGAPKRDDRRGRAGGARRRAGRGHALCEPGDRPCGRRRGRRAGPASSVPRARAYRSDRQRDLGACAGIHPGGRHRRGLSDRRHPWRQHRSRRRALPAVLRHARRHAGTAGRVRFADRRRRTDPGPCRRWPAGQCQRGPADRHRGRPPRRAAAVLGATPGCAGTAGRVRLADRRGGADPRPCRRRPAGQRQRGPADRHRGRPSWRPAAVLGAAASGLCLKAHDVPGMTVAPDGAAAGRRTRRPARIDARAAWRRGGDSKWNETRKARPRAPTPTVPPLPARAAAMPWRWTPAASNT